MNKYASLLKIIDDFLLVCSSKEYGPYTRSDGRKIMIIVDDLGNKKTKSYPKYLVEKHLGKELEGDLTVDHWDSNIENNSLDNLRVVPRDQHSADDTRRVKLVKFKCSWCDKEFERSPRLVRDKAKKKNVGPFCSRICAGKYSRHLQLKLIDKFDSQKSIDSEYFKKKYVKAFTILPDHEIDVFFLDLLAFASGDYFYHETKQEYLSQIKKEGLQPTSYGQSLVSDIDGRVYSPDEYKDMIRQSLEQNLDNEYLSDQEFDNLVEEVFSQKIDPDDLIPRIYIYDEEPESYKYADILLRFPRRLAGITEWDVDEYTTKSIPSEYLEIFIDGKWKKLV